MNDLELRVSVDESLEEAKKKKKKTKRNVKVVSAPVKGKQCIVKLGNGKYRLVSKNGKNMGTFNTAQEADEARVAQFAYLSARGKGKHNPGKKYGDKNWDRKHGESLELNLGGELLTESLDELDDSLIEKVIDHVDAFLAHNKGSLGLYRDRRVFDIEDFRQDILMDVLNDLSENPDEPDIDNFIAASISKSADSHLKDVRKREKHIDTIPTFAYYEGLELKDEAFWGYQKDAGNASYAHNLMKAKEIPIKSSVILQDNNVYKVLGKENIYDIYARKRRGVLLTLERGSEKIKVLAEPEGILSVIEVEQPEPEDGEQTIY